VEAAVVPLEPKRMLSLDDVEMRGLGLSRSKILTIRSLAESLVRGDLDIDALAEAKHDEIHDAITRLRGFGPWSADIYIMFCLGRRDGFAAGDLALQEGARLALGLDKRPSSAELLDIAERWRPWRNVAAGLLWAHYAAVKKLASATPA
jgi:DNA-3-methyladenine glycosylase II